MPNDNTEITKGQKNNMKKIPSVTVGTLLLMFSHLVISCKLVVYF